MKCRKCGEKAAVNMRQHRLALCGEHFLEWLPEQTERFIRKYEMFGREDRVLVAVSGGKDSLSLWDLLVRLGYRTEGLYIGLGIDAGNGYSDASRKCARTFAARNGLVLHEVDIQQEYGQPIPVLAEVSQRGRGRPCAVCGLTKRHVMNRVARDMGMAVLATGHNLDDEAAVLFGNTMNWSGDFLRRQGPVLQGGHGLARKVKPLCRFYEREMAAYALLRGIEYIYEECPFAEGSTSIYHKDVLNRMEAGNPGTKLNFYLRFLEAREQGLFSAGPEHQPALGLCSNCGQPTSAGGICSFCRMIGRASTGA